MSDTNDYPRLIFPDWYDERAEYETSLKGWFSHAVVQLADGMCFPVSFIDPVRLQQDMEEYVKLGTPYFAEPGLIILPEVTVEFMRNSVKDLWKRGYFCHLKPLARNDSPTSGAVRAAALDTVDS